MHFVLGLIRSINLVRSLLLCLLVACMWLFVFKSAGFSMWDVIGALPITKGFNDIVYDVCVSLLSIRYSVCGSSCTGESSLGVVEGESRKSRE